ncbi:hypothetical protein F5X99DRAFT_370276 [Biscogniauxia marginata]|nr:hypothetical protein F5X99DRAFT_370276 [Biscogniauxia marginata]
MVSKLFLTALLASTNILAAPLVTQGSPTAVEKRSFDLGSFTNFTGEADTSKRTTISLRGEFERRAAVDSRTPSNDHNDDGNKKSKKH